MKSGRPDVILFPGGSYSFSSPAVSLNEGVDHMDENRTIQPPSSNGVLNYAFAFIDIMV